MQVSVIIPVYNAEPYIQQAVESALAQPETGEVLLIEDASPDNSLQVCQILAAENEKVILLRHPDGQNRGAGASRNLGIQQAKYEYIAFLDADDFFLPSRFAEAKAHFTAYPTIDGVYEAVGLYFENEAAKSRLETRGVIKPLITLETYVSPDELFESQAPIGTYGYCCTDGWTVKRSIFERTGLFDEYLRLHQDTVMYVKFAALGHMMPGKLREPVAMYRIHDQNRSSATRSAKNIYQTNFLMWSTLWLWGKHCLTEKHRNILLKRFLDFSVTPPKGAQYCVWNRLQRLVTLGHLCWQFPHLSFENYFWQKLWETLPATKLIRNKIDFIRI